MKLTCKPSATSWHTNAIFIHARRSAALRRENGAVLRICQTVICAPGWVRLLMRHTDRVRCVEGLLSRMGELAAPSATQKDEDAEASAVRAFCDS